MIVRSLKNYTFRTLGLYYSSTIDHDGEILLGVPVLLSRGQGSGGHLDRLDLGPMHHGLREGHPSSLDAHGALNSANAGSSITQLLHQAEVKY